jgi:hypothetical protein
MIDVSVEIMLGKFIWGSKLEWEQVSCHTGIETKFHVVYTDLVALPDIW